MYSKQNERKQPKNTKGNLSDSSAKTVSETLTLRPNANT